MACFLRSVGVLIAIALFAITQGCGPKYPKCSKDDHCSEKGEVCVDGTCQQCRDDANCPSGQACKGGRCEAKTECATDSDCSDNRVCRSGKCQTECSSDGDCGAGMKCSSSRCVDKMACSGPADCTGGMECRGGRCQQAQNVSRDMCTMPTVHFEFNESNLSAEGRQALSEIADCIKQKGGTVTIEGHADERGTEEYNLALGDRRARAVERYLATLGVPPNKLRTLTKGEVEPADPGHTEDAWSRNRRAEIKER
jgi:peptidoglycan-associated lipoprotein